MDTPLPEAADPAPASARPRRVVTLLNAASGTADGQGEARLREQLTDAFARAGIEAQLEFSDGPDLAQAAEAARQAAGRGEIDAVVVGGGDGSIRTVAGKLAESGVPLGVIPLGTWNHFAKDLGIPLDADEAVAVIAAGHTRVVDVAEVNGRVFINNSSIGIYPFLVLHRERERRRSGLPKWAALIVAGSRALRHFPLHRLTVRAEGQAEPFRSPCLFVGNNDYALSGLSLGSRERLDQGRLCLFVARQQSVAALAWLALRSLLGRLAEERDLRSLTATAVQIDSRHGALHVACDGEVETLQPPLRYRIRPRALRVFAPAD